MFIETTKIGLLMVQLKRKTETVFTCGCVTYDEQTHCSKHGRSIVAQGSVCNVGFKTYNKENKLKAIKTSKFSKFAKFAKRGYDYIVLNNFKMNDNWIKVLNHIVAMSKPNAIFVVYCDKGQEQEVIDFADGTLPTFQGGTNTLAATDVCGRSTFFYEGAVLFFSTRTIGNLPKVEYLGTENYWERHWIGKFKIKQILEFNATTPKTAYAAMQRGIRCFIHTSHRSVYKAIVDEDYRTIMSENGVQPDGDGLFNDDKDKKDRETKVRTTKILAKENHKRSR